MMNRLFHTFRVMTMRNKMTADNAAEFISSVCMDLLGHAWREEVMLLLGVTAAESGIKYRFQHGEGPARGLWQMEIDTAKDIFLNYLRYEGRRALFYKLKAFAPNLLTTPDQMPHEKDLEHYLTYVDPFACAMCRIHFLRVKEAIPETVLLQAAYWKSYYNTFRGKGTVQGYIRAWHECGCEHIMEKYVES